MSSFTLAKEHLETGLEAAAEAGIEGNAYAQALLWNLLQYYRRNGRTAQDIRDEISYSIDNLEDDGTFHVSRN